MPNLITFNHPTLIKKASLADFNDSELKKIIKTMIKFMEQKNGIGLAAPQINISQQIIVIKTKNNPTILINPKITRKSFKKIHMEEGCLSFPGYFGIVKRPEKIKVSYYNQNGEKIILAADGLLARVLQHEIDHLNGQLFIYKITKFTKGNPDELWSKMRR